MLSDMRAQLQALGFQDSEEPPKPDNSFAARLQRFDWNWRYSDQFLQWASKEEKKLKRILRQHKCPFSWEEIRAWAHNMILEDFEDVSGNGDFYKKGRANLGIAPSEREELITRELFDQIDAWLTEIG